MIRNRNFVGDGKELGEAGNIDIVVVVVVGDKRLRSSARGAKVTRQIFENRSHRLPSPGRYPAPAGRLLSFEFDPGWVRLQLLVRRICSGGEDSAQKRAADHR